jgi:hypothetical protein
MPTPVPGFQVTTPYGKKPKDRTYWQARGFHTGDDYATRRTHAPVVATRDGVVVGAGFGIGGKALGNVVVVKTGNVFHNYCHLHTITVRRGQSVRAGTRLGTVGQTGSGARGIHLHYEERVGVNDIRHCRPPEFNRGTAAPVVAARSAPAAPAAVKKVYLSKLRFGIGKHDPSTSVKHLQARFNQYTRFGGLPVTGYFGPQTLERVKKLQIELGDRPDGELGPKQAGKLMPPNLGYQIIKDV